MGTLVAEERSERSETGREWETGVSMKDTCHQSLAGVMHLPVMVGRVVKRRPTVDSDPCENSNCPTQCDVWWNDVTLALS